ncbi:MAG: HD domain-containing protein [Patescibacteria group bacterium]|nr:HD domain-containing protein [Patescibacteria group bacterium]MDD5490954.1 HD domain-containing protein [Patescibacteria group bacterium]
MDIVQEIKNFVENECKKPSSKYGYEPFIFHFIPVINYVEKLADELGGDKEVMLIAAWLHDIGSIIYGRENHHLTGAKIAEEKLKELGYPAEKIELVKKCILNHRGSQQNSRESIEEQILAEADVMNNFDNIAGIFKAAFVYENLDQGEAKIAARKKLENKWKQLHFDKSKEIIRPKYEAAMLLLK